MEVFKPSTFSWAMPFSWILAGPGCCPLALCSMAGADPWLAAGSLVGQESVAAWLDISAVQGNLVVGSRVFGSCRPVAVVCRLPGRTGLAWP